MRRPLRLLVVVTLASLAVPAGASAPGSPGLRITTPRPGAAVSAPRLLVQLRASPSGLRGFRVRIDGTVVRDAAARRMRIDIRGLRNGRHRLRVSAVGASGQALASRSLTFFVKRAVTAAAASRWVAAGGNDTGRCSKAVPCLTLDRAYHLAAPGAVVEVAGGDYPEQRLTPDPAKAGGPDVTIRPAPGATATIAGIEVTGARHVALEGLSLSGWWTTDGGAADVTFRDINSTSGFTIQGGRDIHVIGGSYGPGRDAYNGVIGAPDGTAPVGILIDGVRFHDWVRSSSGVHMECLHVAAGHGVTVRDSRFWNCAVFDLFVTNWGAQAGNLSERTTGITVENNFFGTARDVNGQGLAYFSLRFEGSIVWQDVLVRNNSSTQEMSFGTDTPGDRLHDFRVVANVAPARSYDCDQRITYSHNVWDGAKCGPTDRNAASGFVDPSTLDLHLRAGAAAIGAGDPHDFPPRDIDGNRRPRGAAPDAGASER